MFQFYSFMLKFLMNFLTVDGSGEVFECEPYKCCVRGFWLWTIQILCQRFLSVNRTNGLWEVFDCEPYKCCLMVFKGIAALIFRLMDHFGFPYFPRISWSFDRGPWKNYVTQIFRFLNSYPIFDRICMVFLS